MISACDRKPLNNIHPGSEPMKVCLIIAEVIYSSPITDLNVYYDVHKRLPPVPDMSQMNQLHAFLPCFVKMRPNTVIPSELSSFKWHITFRISDIISACSFRLFHACFISHPSYPQFVHLVTHLPAFCFSLLLRSKYSFERPVLNVCSFLKVTDQLSFVSYFTTLSVS